MTDSPQPSRPQQVTTAVVISVGACVLAVVNLFRTRDMLRGTAFRDSLTEAQDQAGGLGASNDQLVAVLEVLVFVSGALAAAAAVLAIYAWQRNRAARIGFFVLAGLLALTLPVAGVLPVLLLASGATFLATRPARDWFAGRTPATSSGHLTLSQDGPGATSGRPEPPPYAGAFGSGSSAVPPAHGGSTPQGPPTPGQADPPPTFGPWHGAGTDQAGQVAGPRYGAPYAGQTSAQLPPGYGETTSPYGRDPDRRPGTVTAACAVTWLGTVVVAAFVAVLALVLAVDRARFLREFQRQADARSLNVSEDQILAVVWTVIGIGLFWCVAAAVLAVLAFRRSRGARIGLAVSAAMTVLVSLLLILSFVAVVPLLLGIAVLVLLFTGGANEWYARRPSYGQFAGGQFPGGQFPGGPPPPYEQQPPGSHQPPRSGRPGPW